MSTSPSRDLADREEQRHQNALGGRGKLPKSLREQLRVVFAHQLRIVWVTYVHEMLGGSTMTAKRRRDLVLQLPVGTLTPINGIPQLTPDLATHGGGLPRGEGFLRASACSHAPQCGPFPM